MNYYQALKEVQRLNPEIEPKSGIYILVRKEHGFKYGYVGQAKNVVNRLAEHFSSYGQHIDYSIHKHGLLTEDNPAGWTFEIIYCNEIELDERERHYMLEYANAGYQLRNKTSGGQDSGKFAIDDYKPQKGYRDGLKKGYENARKDVQKLFEKNLTYSINGNSGKLKERSYNKFKEFLQQ